MFKFPKHDKTYFRKLAWVEHEFFKPAFDQFCRNQKLPLSPDEYCYFVTNLFTKESNVQVLTFNVSVDFVYGEIFYCCILGYIDSKKTIKATKPIMVRCRVQPK